MTFRRLTLSLCIILASCGCQATSSSRLATSPDLDARLTAIEHSRIADSRAEMAAQAAAEDHAIRPPFSPDPRARRTSTIATANRAVSLAAVSGDQVAARGADFDFAPGGSPLTMGDLNDESGAEQPDIEFADTTALEREQQYLRRPPLGSFWDTLKRDVKHMPKDLWHDTKRVYANPVNLVILGSAYGGALAVQESGVDNTVEDHYDRHHSFSHDWRDAFATAGNPGTHFALAGLWYLVGQQSGDEKTYEVGKTMFSALIINGLSVMASQAATWDRSPNGELGSFFSGHTSSSFVMASVLHEAYGHWVGIPMYGLASLVAVERLDSGEHYFSDVAMGAVVGTVIGHSVASGRDPELFGWQVVPYVSESGASGIGLMKSY